jgi:hypothetical protein
MKTTNNKLTKKLVFLGVVLLFLMVHSNVSKAQNTVYIINLTNLNFVVSMKTTDNFCIPQCYTVPNITISPNSTISLPYCFLNGTWFEHQGSVELVGVIPSTPFDLCNIGPVPITGGGFTINFIQLTSGTVPDNDLLISVN